MADLKQVAAIFNDCIEAIRNQRHPNLKKKAVDWLKGARYELMRKIEAEYYKLAQARDNPSSQPSWALNPSDPLCFFTTNHAPILRPYKDAFIQNLYTLLTDCGFRCTVNHWPGSCDGDSYFISIYFPHRLTNGNSKSAPVPKTLQIDDEFSNARTGRKFARLLLGNGEVEEEDEEDGNDGNGNDPSGSGSRRSTSTSSRTLSETSQLGPRRSTRRRDRQNGRSVTPRSVSRSTTVSMDRASTLRRSTRIKSEPTQ